jgi:RNA polymerase sigma-70 factor (ECF subfamily)
LVQFACESGLACVSSDQAMMASEDDLVNRATQGDQDALITLLQRYGPAVRARLVGQIPRRWHSVLSEDDVMQQTYANAIAKIQQFTSRSESAFARWLETTARCNLSDALKMLAAHKRGGNRPSARRRTLDESLLVLWEGLSSAGTTPSGGISDAEARAALQRAIDELPETYARVVKLYDLQGKPVEEVAALLKRSPGAVFMLRARAHERLHEIMGRTTDFFSGSS